MSDLISLVILLEVLGMEQKLELYAIIPPNKNDIEDFPLADALASTGDGAWERFCYPALNRAAYEQDGFEAKKVLVTVRVI